MKSSVVLNYGIYSFMIILSVIFLSSISMSYAELYSEGQIISEKQNITKIIPDDEKSYTVYDAKIYDKESKEITFSSLSKEYIYEEEKEKTTDEILYLNKSTYYGSADVSLKIQVDHNATREIPYECNCKDTFSKDEKNYTIETECGICYRYENYTYYTYENIDKSKFVLDNETKIYEVFEPKTFSILPDGTWGYSIYTEPVIMGVSVPDATFWNGSWGTMYEVTIDHTLIDSDLSNFPILLNLSSSNIDYSITKDDGSDFRATDNNNNVLYHYIDTWNESGNSYVIVNIPTISSTTDTKFYIFCNNSDAVDTSSSSAFNSGYTMVHTMKDYNTTHIFDATSYGNDGIKVSANNPIQVGGYIGYGQYCDGNDKINVGSDSSISTISNLSANIWVKVTGGGVDWDVIFARTLTYTMAINNDYYGTYDWGVGAIGTGINIDDGEWHNIGLTFQDSVPDTGHLYIDGVEINTFTYTSEAGSYDTMIGVNSPSGTEYFTGIIDNIYFSNVYRDSAWMKAEYQSQTDNLTTIGTARVMGENNYWRENETTVWIRINSTDGSQVTATITNDTTYPQDGEAVFIFFDDFEDSSINTTKWTGTTSGAHISDGIMTYYGDGDWKYLKSNIAFGSGTYRMRVMGKLNTTIPYASSIGLQDSGSEAVIFSNGTYRTCLSGDCEVTSYLSEPEDWYLYEFDSDFDTYATLWRNDTAEAVHTSKVGNVSMNISFGSSTTAHASFGDWVQVIEVYDNPPSVSCTDNLCTIDPHSAGVYVVPITTTIPSGDLNIELSYVTDSCTCPSVNTNYEINLGDKCRFNTACNLGYGNLTLINDTAGNYVYINSTFYAYSIEAFPDSAIVYIDPENGHLDIYE